MFFVAAFHLRGLFLRGFFLVLCAFFTLTVAHAGQVNLAWDPNTEPDLAGYRVYYGLGSRNYDQVMDVGNCTSCLVTGLEQGRTYYFAATAVNTANSESDFSNEVSAALSTSNQPPLANAGPDQNIKEGMVVSLNGANSTDPEGGALTYSWCQVSGTPVTLDNPSGPQATFTPPNVGADGETLGFQLTVTDSGGLQSSDTCLVNVLWINQPPSANAGPDLNVNEGTMVTLNGSNSRDPDGVALNYEWLQTSGSAVTLSSRFAAQPTFAAPNVGPEGETLMFQLTVTDSGGIQARDSCIVNVVWVNQPPAANAGPDQNVNQGASVTLNGTGSADPDGGLLAYSWLQTGGTPVTMDNPGSAQPRFVANTGGASTSLVFRLTVTDPGALSASDQCSVVVSGAGSGMDLSGQWLSLSRAVRKSVSTFKGKIRVKNLGGEAAPSSVLYVYQSQDPTFQNTDLLIGKATVASIPAGGYVDVSLRLSAPYDGSTVYLLAVPDGTNALSETDETNNVVVSGLVQ
jgi:K319L-like, PKD domain/CARDB/Fibronectin type III domain